MTESQRKVAGHVKASHFSPPEGMYLLFRPDEPSRSRYETTSIHKFDNGVIRLTVMPGAKTDLASIPWFLRWAFSPSGRWQRAAVFHDRGCEQAANPEDRHFADVMFRNMCRHDGVGSFMAWVLYWGVRIGAWHWTLTRKAKR